jgi:hypothetical protein
MIFYLKIKYKVNFLDIIYHPVFYLKTMFWRLDSVSVYRWKPTQLGPIDRTSPYPRCGLSPKRCKTGRWIMSKKLMTVLIYRRHKLSELINKSIYEFVYFCIKLKAVVPSQFISNRCASVPIFLSTFNSHLKLMLDMITLLHPLHIIAGKHHCIL